MKRVCLCVCVCVFVFVISHYLPEILGSPISNLADASQVTCYHGVLDCKSEDLSDAQLGSLDKCSFITHCPNYGEDLQTSASGFVRCTAVNADGSLNEAAANQVWPALVTKCCDTTGITV